MKPNKQELLLPTENHDALLADLRRIAATGLLPAEQLNTDAAAVFLGEVVKRHLPDDIRQVLQDIQMAGRPPITVIGNLPTTEAEIYRLAQNASEKTQAGASESQKQRSLKEAKLISVYLLHGMAALLNQDCAEPVALGNRKNLILDQVEERLISNTGVSGDSTGPGLGYHRDGLSNSEGQFARGRYPAVDKQYSLLLGERENIHSATFFIDPSTPGIGYFQNVLPSHRNPPFDAQPVVLMSGELCVFRNNDVLHGRTASMKADPEHKRLLSTGVVMESHRKYTVLPSLLQGATLEEQCAAVAQAGRKETGVSTAR